jgi:hypothetical protein
MDILTADKIAGFQRSIDAWGLTGLAGAPSTQRQSNRTMPVKNQNDLSKI